ncbi:hypothetical protein TUBRATIS_12460 [Tubulinosema ratisbonensis]|uniref:Uncharacterized protein n=1 Tax=Tubulinosema ratisbonensis TaxID=291195 RepID=A0A437AM38_9MICR|nr:hypothetical protein TUBRATIS_12460 [Tubulinosema ratisbonensis]
MTVLQLNSEIKNDRNVNKNYESYIEKIKENLINRVSVLETLESFVYLDSIVYTDSRTYRDVITLMKLCIDERNAVEIYYLWAKILINQRKFEYLDDFIFVTLSFNDYNAIKTSYCMLFDVFDDYFYKFMDLLSDVKELSFIFDELKNRMESNVTTVYTE